MAAIMLSDRSPNLRHAPENSVAARQITDEEPPYVPSLSHQPYSGA